MQYERTTAELARIKDCLAQNLFVLLQDAIRDNHTNAIIRLHAQVIDSIIQAVDAMGKSETLRDDELRRMEELECDNYFLRRDSLMTALEQLPPKIKHAGGIKQRMQTFWLTIRPAKEEIGEIKGWTVYYQRHHDKRASKLLPKVNDQSLIEAARIMLVALKEHGLI